MNGSGRSLAYLVGAPRVSTRLDTAMPGPRSHVLGVIGAFQKLGWEVKPFIAGDELPLRLLAGRQTGRILESNVATRIGADLLRLGSGVVSGFRALARAGRVDWVYERLSSFQMLGQWFQGRGIPWILESNGPFFAEATQDRTAVALTGIARAIEVAAYRRADVVISVTQDLAHIIIDESGIDPFKVVIMPNGVDTESFAPGNVPSTRLLGGCVVGFIGLLTPWQRLDLLIETIAELRQEGLRELRLVVIGDGPMRKAWEGLARSVGLASDVRFVGLVSPSEVRTYIEGFDIGYSGQAVLSTGRMYMSPLKLYEYAAMARPVIASAFADAMDIIHDGWTGYLFSPGSKEDLKRVLRKAYFERDRWPEMGRRAREEVVERHSWVARVQQMIAAVEEVLEARYGTAYPARHRG